MITTEEDDIVPDMQYFWRSTNSTDKVTIVNTTLNTFMFIGKGGL